MGYHTESRALFFQEKTDICGVRGFFMTETNIQALDARLAALEEVLQGEGSYVSQYSGEEIDERIARYPGAAVWSIYGLSDSKFSIPFARV